MQIIKRNEKIVEFDVEKIKNAISKAYDEVNANYDENTLNYLGKEITKQCYDGITVEEIQNIVEIILMKENPSVAQAYIRYRYKREIVRNSEADFFNAVGKKLKGETIDNQNANVDEHSFGGRMGEANDLLMKKYALDNIISKKARYNHTNNRIYIHDLSQYAVGNHNCLTCPIDDLLEKGFKTRQTDIRPANSVNTAFQLLAVIFQIQSLQQFGGVSCSHLDWSMVPYVRKSFFKHYKDGLKYIEGLNEKRLEKVINSIEGIDVRKISIDDTTVYRYEGAYLYAFDMIKRELKQSVEAMYHNLNSLQSRSGNQLPFSSINLGSCTLTEGKMVTKAILEGCINGVGKLHKTSVFPCVIYQVKHGINLDKEDPNYDLFRLALKSTAKRLYPNYVNIDWSGNAGYDPDDPKQIMATMGLELNLAHLKSFEPCSGVWLNISC